LWIKYEDAAKEAFLEILKDHPRLVVEHYIITIIAAFPTSSYSLFVRNFNPISATMLIFLLALFWTLPRTDVRLIRNIIIILFCTSLPIVIATLVMMPTADINRMETHMLYYAFIIIFILSCIPSPMVLKDWISKARLKYQAG